LPRRESCWTRRARPARAPSRGNDSPGTALAHPSSLRGLAMSRSQKVASMAVLKFAILYLCSAHSLTHSLTLPHDLIIPRIWKLEALKQGPTTQEGFFPLSSQSRMSVLFWVTGGFFIFPWVSYRLTVAYYALGCHSVMNPEQLKSLSETSKYRKTKGKCNGWMLEQFISIVASHFVYWWFCTARSTEIMQVHCDWRYAWMRRKIFKDARNLQFCTSIKPKYKISKVCMQWFCWFNIIQAYLAYRIQSYILDPDQYEMLQPDTFCELFCHGIL